MFLEPIDAGRAAEDAIRFVFFRQKVNRVRAVALAFFALKDVIALVIHAGLPGRFSHVGLLGRFSHAGLQRRAKVNVANNK